MIKPTGLWWNAPSEGRFRQYYLTLRWHYEMPALEAFNYAKRAFEDYPGFMSDTIGTLRSALRAGDERGGKHYLR